MRYPIAKISVFGLFLTLAPTLASAQAPIPVNGSPGTSGTTVPSDQPDVGGTVSGPQWTPEMVLPQQPFGRIDTSSAGTTPRSVNAWSQQQSPDALAEVTGRCSVIGSPSYSSRYPTESVQFCSNYAAGRKGG